MIMITSVLFQLLSRYAFVVVLPKKYFCIIIVAMHDLQEKTGRKKKSMQTFQITIPNGAEGKETIEFQLPDGRAVCISRVPWCGNYGYL